MPLPPLPALPVPPAPLPLPLSEPFPVPEPGTGCVPCFDEPDVAAEGVEEMIAFFAFSKELAFSAFCCTAGSGFDAGSGSCFFTLLSAFLFLSGEDVPVAGAPPPCSPVAPEPVPEPPASSMPVMGGVMSGFDPELPKPIQPTRRRWQAKTAARHTRISLEREKFGTCLDNDGFCPVFIKKGSASGSANNHSAIIAAIVSLNVVEEHSFNRCLDLPDRYMAGYKESFSFSAQI